MWLQTEHQSCIYAVVLTQAPLKRELVQTWQQIVTVKIWLRWQKTIMAYQPSLSSSTNAPHSTTDVTTPSTNRTPKLTHFYPFLWIHEMTLHLYVVYCRFFSDCSRPEHPNLYNLSWRWTANLKDILNGLSDRVRFFHFSSATKSLPNAKCQAFLPVFHHLPKPTCTTCLRSCPEFAAKACETWTQLCYSNQWINAPGWCAHRDLDLTLQFSWQRLGPLRIAENIYDIYLAFWLGRWAQGLPFGHGVIWNWTFHTVAHPTWQTWCAARRFARSTFKPSLLKPLRLQDDFIWLQDDLKTLSRIETSVFSLEGIHVGSFPY